MGHRSGAGDRRRRYAPILYSHPTVDTYGNRANAVQANMYFSDWGEPDHNPPFVAIRR